MLLLELCGALTAHDTCVHDPMEPYCDGKNLPRTLILYGRSDESQPHSHTLLKLSILVQVTILSDNYWSATFCRLIIHSANCLHRQ
jgi:hypothetical protein